MASDAESSFSVPSKQTAVVVAAVATAAAGGLSQGFRASRRAAAVDSMQRWRPYTQGLSGGGVSCDDVFSISTPTRKVWLVYFSHPLLTQASTFLL